MTNQPRPMLLAGNAAAAIFAYCWAYSAYMYNWLNVGGGTSHYIESWIVLSEVLPYAALIAWLTTIALSVAHPSCRKQTQFWRISAGFSSFAIAPAVFFAADWFLHRDFPPPPPL